MAGGSGGRVVNVVIAGLGGQGVLKASDIVAGAAFGLGLDVKKSEVHGMSQRGGSVRSDIRYGPRVDSPMVPPGEADFLVVLAPDQVEAALPVLRRGGVLIGTDRISEDRLPNRRSLNTALIGALSAYLDLPEEAWQAALAAAFPAKILEANRAAFSLGRGSVPPRAAGAAAGA
jgi:indolepyruvate ferredoxin oxidoreductase, beta subunit